MNETLIGKTFGRWTVLGEAIKVNGQRKWPCKCDCGTERYVLERALKSGGSMSCGCLRREKVSEALSQDLTGKQFGDLRVLNKADEKGSRAGVKWICKCSCGNTYSVSATLLITGKRQNCGCKASKGKEIADIKGRCFGLLTAEYATEGRDNKGSVIWHCKCDCGNEVEVSYNKILYTKTISCGCQKKKQEQRLNTFLQHVDGTSVDMLKSKKIPTNNTTGVKGVYYIRGKYMAKIVFQKKQYVLGNYDTLEEAADARHQAEEELNNVVLEHYEKWQQKAKIDPLWAEANPIKYIVNKESKGYLSVECFPQIS